MGEVYLTEQVGFKWIERRWPVVSGELLGPAVLSEFACAQFKVSKAVLTSLCAMMEIGGLLGEQNINAAPFRKL